MSTSTREEQAAKAKEFVRNGWLAYLGMYSAAFERLSPRLDKLNASSGSIIEELIAKGEALETTAQEKFETVREAANDHYSARIEKLRGMMPNAGEEKAEVAELQAEIEELNKKITKLTKKVGTIDKAVKAA